MSESRADHPQFDAMMPAQEQVAIEFCREIAGLKGENPSPPDPVRLLEMAEALYWAEVNPARSREVQQILMAAKRAP